MTMRANRIALAAAALVGVTTVTLFATSARAQAPGQAAPGQAAPNQTAPAQPAQGKPALGKPGEGGTPIQPAAKKQGMPGMGGTIQPAPAYKAPQMAKEGPFDPKSSRYANLKFNTKVGSFKVLGTDEVLAQGTLKMSFKGTVMVSDLEPGGTVNFTGNVRKEYTTDDKRKTLYFGKGTITVAGRYKSLQFFGQDLDANFFGLGIFRLYGEFDKDLKTGTYQVDQGEKMPWGTNGMQVAVPNPQMSSATRQGIKVKKDN